VRIGDFLILVFAIGVAAFLLNRIFGAVT